MSVCWAHYKNVWLCKSLQRQVALFDQTFAFLFSLSSQPPINHGSLNDPSIFTFIDLLFFRIFWPLVHNCVVDLLQLLLRIFGFGSKTMSAASETWLSSVNCRNVLSEMRLQDKKACKPEGKHWPWQSRKTRDDKKKSATTHSDFCIFFWLIPHDGKFNNNYKLLILTLFLQRDDTACQNQTSSRLGWVIYL